MLLYRLLLVAAASFLLLGGSAGAEGFSLLKLDANYVKWDQPVAGTGARITYLFIKESHDFPNARNCRAMEPFKLHSESGNLEQKEIRKAFEDAAFQWMSVANVEFVEVQSAKDADLLIGGQRTPRGQAFANVVPARAERITGMEKALGLFSRHNLHDEGPQWDESPELPLQPIKKAMVCLNPAVPWKIGFDGNMDVYDLQYTFLHELGHVLGLNHSGPHDSVMSFRYTESFGNLQDSDISGVIHLYGPRSGFRAFKAD
jgi:predicted Zn-dependent protease